MLPNMIGYCCDYRYWPYTLGRSVGLYTGECVVDSGTVLWDRAQQIVSAHHGKIVDIRAFPILKNLNAVMM